MLAALLETYAAMPYHRGKESVARWALDTFHISVSGEREVIRDGLRWRLNPSDYVHQSLYWTGRYNIWQVYHLRRALPDGGTFFDIGANFGYYSAVLAYSVPRLLVHAFEPNPETYARLAYHATANRLDYIRAHRLGLSDRPGRAGLSSEYADNSGGAYITAGNSIELTTLDDFCRERGVGRIDAMKIDVEGHEEKMLRGGLASLDRFRPAILIELSPAAQRRSGSSIETIINLLESAGYGIYQIDRDRCRPLSHLPDGDEIVDALCIYSGRSSK